MTDGTLQIIPVRGIGEIGRGDDVATASVDATRDT